MTTIKRDLFVIFICIFILCTMIFSIKDTLSSYSFTGNGLKIIFSNYKKYLGNILWSKIDEFYHISNTMQEKDLIDVATLAFKLNPHNAYFTSITILHMANIDFNKEYAEKLGQDYIKKNPKDPQIHRILGALGWLHLKNKEYSDAESALLTALKVVRNNKIDFSTEKGEFLFPLNYITMLEYIYIKQNNKSKLDQITEMKADLQNSGYTFSELDIEKEVNKEEEAEHHEHHHHSEMLFMWQRMTGEELEEK